MKPTNEAVIIQLRHMASGREIAWQMSPHAVPAVYYIDERIEELRASHAGIVEQHDLPKTEQGTVDIFKVEDDAIIEQLSAINKKIMKLKIDALVSVLDPVEDLPEGYDTKRDLIEECIGSHEVIPTIMGFFSKHSASTISSAGRGSSLIRFEKPGGESIDPLAREPSDSSP